MILFFAFFLNFKFQALELIVGHSIATITILLSILISLILLQFFQQNYKGTIFCYWDEIDLKSFLALKICIYKNSKVINFSIFQIIPKHLKKNNRK